MKKIVLILISYLMVGCATNLSLQVQPELVKSFKHEPMPNDTETHVYVIRGPAFQGGAYGLEVGLEENLVTSLASGSYDLLKLGGQFNTIYLSQFGQTFQHKFIDKRAGELLFFYFNPDTGEFNEVRPALGKSLVMQTKRTSKSTSRSTAEHYHSALMNPSAMGLNVKTSTDVAPKKPNSEFAMLSIARPSTMMEEFELAIWSKDELLGVIGGEEVINILLPAGKQSIYTYINGFSPLDMSLEAGKTYYVKIDLEKNSGSIGTPWKLVSKWTALNATKKSEFFESDFSGLKVVGVDPQVINEESSQHRINQAVAYIKFNMKRDLGRRIPKITISSDMGM